MATAEVNKELDDLAFRIYSQRLASRQMNRGGEQETIEAYRMAEAFIETRDKINRGVIKTAKPGQLVLADCCAPNLPRTHPHNLVAQLHTDRQGTQTPGDPNKINRIGKFLNDNPTPESNPDELIVKLNRQFPDLGWDLPTINVARAIFPAYMQTPK